MNFERLALNYVKKFGTKFSHMFNWKGEYFFTNQARRQRADFKSRFTKKILLQSGIAEFLNTSTSENCMKLWILLKLLKLFFLSRFHKTEHFAKLLPGEALFQFLDNILVFVNKRRNSLFQVWHVEFDGDFEDLCSNRFIQNTTEVLKRKLGNIPYYTRVSAWLVNRQSLLYGANEQITSLVFNLDEKKSITFIKFAYHFTSSIRCLRDPILYLTAPSYSCNRLQLLWQ